VNIEEKVNELLSDPILFALKNNKEDVFNERQKFLLEGTIPLYELWKKDEEMKHPFFNDSGDPNPKEELAEHERIGNLSIQ
jgi:hypothetical protein